jgi:hypothetical protein
MKRTPLLFTALLALTACSDNREKVVQSQRGSTDINQTVPIQTNNDAGIQTDADIMQDMDAAGTPGVTNDTTGSTTSGALNDPTGTPVNAPPNGSRDTTRGTQPPR